MRRTAVWLAGQAAAFVFVSWASLASFAARCTRRRNWIVVRNGVDVEEFHTGPGAFPADIDIPLGAPTALLVGRLDPAKGVLDVVRAWPQVLEAVPGATLLLVGSSPDRPQLVRAIAEAGVVGHTVLTGLRADVPELMRASDVVLLPTWADALPTMLMEAGACGRPVVSTVVGGVPEIVPHGISGLLTFPGDRTGLAESIATVLADPLRAEQMGRRGREIVERRFDAIAWARRLRGVYDAAVTGQRVSQNAFEATET